MKNVIFLFSLPRSGSTLLQRILMSHEKISSVSEPWILLPFLRILKLKDGSGEYGPSPSCEVIKDFIKELPNKEKDYQKEMKSFIFSIYNKVTDVDSDYFLDKTPRYYYIIPEIAKVFPDAKFIFLFRNPLAVMSSVSKTWYGGKLYFGGNYQDLYSGPELLAEGYKLLADKSVKVKYENLVNNTEEELKKIFRYLNLEFDNADIDNFNRIKLNGEMGDPNKYDYKKIEAKLAGKWKKFFNTKFRQKYAKKYLSYLSKDVLNIFGYNKDELLGDFIKPKKKCWQFISDMYFLKKQQVRLVLLKIIRKYFKSVL